jgi:hypothetical protein
VTCESHGLRELTSLSCFLLCFVPSHHNCSISSIESLSSHDTLNIQFRVNHEHTKSIKAANRRHDGLRSAREPIVTIHLYNVDSY